MPGHNEPLEEGVDQLTQWRERCADHVAELKAVLDECNDRVNSRTNTEETCHQVRLLQKFHRFYGRFASLLHRLALRLLSRPCCKSASSARQ
ncbi:unnamed protein product [Nippostrongylus brasiliensis]|uniref:Cytochrome b-c1 complex subunit 6 (inferred by orthology to a C. elegans protein) n=1 Tax=Nippostrongylus brasiliensis TaxID=27835 RepID=A0A0N4YSU4_NIPBR|nr:unnamed protein product [Nippostrongylus brasiliensis]